MDKKYDCISREEALLGLYNLFYYAPPHITQKFQTQCVSKIKNLPSIEKVYVVTENGWMDSFTHGELIYLVGVFTDKDMAKKVAEEHNAKITEIELNKVFPLKGNKDKMCNENDYLLGGYVEE